MGRPILPVEVPVTISTMLKLYWAEFKINSVLIVVNYSSLLEINNTDSKTMRETTEHIRQHVFCVDC